MMISEEKIEAFIKNEYSIQIQAYRIQFNDLEATPGEPNVGVQTSIGSIEPEFLKNQNAQLTLGT